MREDYAQSYEHLYNHHWWWRARERFILDVLKAKQPPEGWRNILDVGCGNGLFFDKLLQFGDVEGVELSASLLNNSAPHRSRIHVGDFDPALGLTKKYGLILMLDVLEHMPDPVTALRFAATRLAANGKLLITVPAFKALWTDHDAINQHFARYTKSSFREIVRQADLHIETERYFFHWLFPIKMATHILENTLRTQPSLPRVPVAWINKLAYWFSLIESKICFNSPLPFGSSLLVFASKDAEP